MDPDSPTVGPRAWHFARRAPALAFGLVLLLVGALLGYFLLSSHRQTGAAVEDAVGNDAIVLADKIETVLLRVKATATLVSDALADVGWPPPPPTDQAAAPDRVLAAFARDFPEAVAITVRDADGRVVLSSVPRPPVGTAGDDPGAAEMAARASTLATGRMEFSGVTVSRVDGHPLMFAYQPIVATGGIRRGTVVIAIDLTPFLRVARAMRLDDGEVHLHRADDNRLMLQLAGDDAALNSATATPTFDAIRSGSGSGTTRHRDANTGAERIAGYAVTRHFPFYVEVAVGERAAFARWRQAAYASVALAAAVLLVAGILLALAARIEAARRRSDALYRAAVEHQTDAVCRWRPDGALTFANAAYRGFFEPPGTALLGLRWFDHLPPSLRERAEAQVAAWAAARTSGTCDVSTPCRDGTIRRFQWRATPIVGDDGNVVEFQAVGRDVTTERAAEDRIRENEERLRLALQVAGLGWFDIDFAVWESTESASCAQMLGEPALERRWSLDDWLATLHPDDRAPLRATFEAAYRSVDLPHVEYRRRARDGHYRWLSSVGAIVSRDAAGRALRGVGITLDVTDRKRADAVIRESEQRFRTIANSGAAIIWTCTPEGTLDYVNDRATAYFGRTHDEVTAHWVEVLHPDDRAATLAAFATGLRKRQHFWYEARARRADGAWRWLRNDGFPRYDSAGAYIGLIGYAIDVDESKQAAIELERHRHDLQGLVRERTAELSHAKERADAANRAKSAFLANMSHEIRTPLNAITGMAYLMQREGATPAQRSRLERIDIASHHLLEIVNSVLELSKIEAGKLELAAQPVDLQALVAGVVAIVADRAAAKDLPVVIDGPLPAGRFSGDEARLREALLNFVTNAVKFTARGRVTVRVQETGGDALAATLRFEVRDTGPGIDAADLARLFTPFEQVDNSTTRRHGGTGLGLAITRRLAERMGGDAGATSEPGRGSTFWFTVRLPRVASAPEAAAATAPRDAEAVVRQRHAGRRVLVVEDEPINREVVRFLLEEAGLVVETAENGEEAVARATATAYDAIVMDVQMPGVDGLGATRRIRPLRPRTPIIALTANAFAEDRRLCLAAGMDDFLAKPVEPAELFGALLRWLERAPRAPVRADASVA